MGKQSGRMGYYLFLKTYCREPIDYDDYVDGIKVIETDTKIYNFVNKVT